MRVTVQTYAGYRGDERPSSFSLEDRILRIMDIVDRWYDPDHNIFKVLADDGGIYLLRHDMNGTRRLPSRRVNPFADSIFLRLYFFAAEKPRFFSSGSGHQVLSLKTGN